MQSAYESSVFNFTLPVIWIIFVWFDVFLAKIGFIAFVSSVPLFLYYMIKKWELFLKW